MSSILGPTAVGAVLFLFVMVWCFANRRVDRSLAALGLYLGLLDGYLKLRTGSTLIGLVPDLLLAAIAVGALIRALRSDQALSLPPLGGLVVAFGLIVIAEMFNPMGRNPAGALAGLAQDLEYVPLFFLGFAFIRRKKQIRWLLVILVVCASAGGVVGFYQSRLTPDQFASWGPGYSERVLGTGPYAGAARVQYENGVPYVRPFGLGSDIGAGGLIAALAFPALIALMLGPRGRLRAAGIPLAGGIALAVATSGTRAGLIVFVVCGLAFTLIATRTRHAIRAIAGLAVGAALVFGAFQILGSQNVASSRAQSVTPTNFASTFSAHSGPSTLLLGHYLTEYPLGVGTGSVGPAATQFTNVAPGTGKLNAETAWNFLILETGIPGLAIVLILLARLLWVSFARIRHIADPELRLYLAALAAPLLGLVAGGFTAPITATVPQAPYLWLVAGILSYWLFAAFRDLQPDPAPVREESPSRPVAVNERRRMPVSAVP